MRIGSTVFPGQRGTKKLLTQYGKKLVCVRYRYDEIRKKRFKTVELIVEESGWEPKSKAFRNSDIVWLQIGVKEVEARAKVKRAGGKWDAAEQVWKLRYDAVKKIGLESRIVRDESFHIYKQKSFY